MYKTLTDESSPLSFEARHAFLCLVLAWGEVEGEWWSERSGWGMMVMLIKMKDMVG